jgi:preprotein translocase subunit YajC
LRKKLKNVWVQRLFWRNQMNDSLIQSVKDSTMSGSLMQMVLMFAAMFAIFYFILIRPQQKQQKKHQDMLMGLKKGDEVMISSGILGKIFSVEEKFINLEIADKTKIKVLKQSVQAVLNQNTEEKK